MRFILNAVRGRTWLTFLVAWTGLAIGMSAWAMATPLGGGPDEPAHIIKAASVARGELLGALTSTPGVTEVTVASGIARASSWPCYAFHPEQDASCIEPVHAETGTKVVTTSAGLYNPVFYAAVGWPSALTTHTRVAVYAMRLMNALLSSFFLAVTFTTLMLFRAPIVTGVAFFAAVTPMVLFLGGVVNPNALEISSGAALLTLLLALVRGHTIARPGPYFALVVVSGFFLANARGLSPLWMALIAVTALLFATGERLTELARMPLFWVTLLLLAASVVGAGLWILSTNTLASMGTYPGAGKTHPIDAFWFMLIERSFDPGYFGVFGWLDSFAPNGVLYFWGALGFGVGILGYMLARGRVLAALIFVTAGFLLLPPIVQAASVESSGYIWQGRYSLVAYVAVILVAAVAASVYRPADVSWLQPRAVVRGARIFGFLVIFGQLLAFVATIKRYAVGADATAEGTWTAFFFATPLWRPPGGAVLWTVAAGLGLVLVFLAWSAWVSPALLPPTGPQGRRAAVRPDGTANTQYRYAK
jgi:hypothetical protein